MKVSVKWLKDYVAVPPLAELSERLTMAGFEVEGVENPGDLLRGIVVAQIKSSIPHPQAEKLSVTHISVGEGDLIQVVCGAKNFKVGDKVPFAQIGAQIPGGPLIEKALLRGIESFGMLCSAKELGIPEGQDGLLILDAGAPLGQPIAEVLELDDQVLELNVTPNRPDALCHVGIAREISVFTGAELKQPTFCYSSAPTSDSGELAIEVSVESPERCPRYSGRIVRGVKVGPSPQWMVNRLKASGMRSINNVVDITNYVLLELGQPLHAFDFACLAGSQIVVRQARQGEKLTTLDRKERLLDVDDLIICDRNGPQVLAGVMGGSNSEVSASTRDVFLESASFEPTTVRRSSKRHGLHTESSHRFERGTDIRGVAYALDRAADLIAGLAGGRVQTSKIDIFREPQPRQIVLRYRQLNAVLGSEISSGRILSLLSRLGFACLVERPEGAEFEVPSFRIDVEREEDLIEEVARTFGYNALPSRLPSTCLPPPSFSDRQKLETRIHPLLQGLGLSEVVNYSFVSEEELAVLEQCGGAIKIKNALSTQQSVMRTSLYPGLIQNFTRALKQQAPGVRFYEFGSTYHQNIRWAGGAEPVALESPRVAGLVWGRRSERLWKDKEVVFDFFDVKAIVESVFGALRVTGVRHLPAENAPHLHPRARVSFHAQDGTVVGELGELHPKVSKQLLLPPGVFVFDLDAQYLAGWAPKIPLYLPLAKFPAVLRDIALVVPREKSSEEIRQLILLSGAPWVESASLFDLYEAPPVPPGHKNLAFALSYRAAERTMTDPEVNQIHQRIIDGLQNNSAVSLRIN